jgi:Cellulase (glycosyl hydrolase family 5)
MYLLLNNIGGINLAARTSRNSANTLGLLLSLLLLSGLSNAELLFNAEFEGELVHEAICPPQDSRGAKVSGTIADGWRDDTCWADSTNGVTYSTESLEGRHDSTAQKMEVTKEAILAQPIVFLERMYVAKVWLRAATSMTVQIEMRQAAAPYYYYKVERFAVTPNWAEFKIAGLTGATPGLLIIHPVSSGELWIDDASLESLMPVLPTTATPAQYFGMHIHNADGPDPWRQRTSDARVPINSVRLWSGAGSAWLNACPRTRCPASHSDPTWSWSTLDKQVNRALSNSADLIFTLGGVTPTWASARPDECSPWNNHTGGHSAEALIDQYWIDWVTAVGTRYKSKIRFWEIWNEPHFDKQKNTPPNCFNFFTGTPQKLKLLAEQATRILKQIDPTNLIISPSADAPQFLESYLAIGGSHSADIVGYHFYACDVQSHPSAALPATSPERSYLGDIPLIRSIVDTYDATNKPIWNTEEGRLGCPHLDDQMAAAYLARSLILKRAAGIGRFYFYAWDEGAAKGGIDLFLTDPDTHSTLTAAGIAYREVANWLIDNRILSVTTDANNTWIVQTDSVSGNKGDSYLVWNPSYTGGSSNLFTIPPGWAVTEKQNLSGVSEPISSDRTSQINSSPVRFH